MDIKKKNKTCFNKGRVFYKITNIKGPIDVWVPKSQVVPITNIFNPTKETHIMVPGQWVLVTRDRRKVYITRLSIEERRKGYILRIPR